MKDVNLSDWIDGLPDEPEVGDVYIMRYKDMHSIGIYTYSSLGCGTYFNLFDHIPYGFPNPSSVQHKTFKFVECK